MTQLLNKPRVVVKTNNVMKPPLLDTTEAHLIEFYDTHNDLIALFCRVLADDLWGLVFKTDEDWDSTLIRYGYKLPDKELLIQG